LSLELVRSSRYEVLGRIASGGMATVYVARMHGAGAFSRLVAVKKPHSFVTKNPRLRQKLQHEARVASMIHHPNVVAVLDVDESDGELALIMDYVDGCTLKELLEHAENAGERIQRAVVRILLDVAAGLHAAHSLRDANGALLGVVHRDVSPHNVLVGRDGIARLADFGIAKIASLESEPTATDAIAGKLAYLAPEYLSTKQFDAQSDLFSLGVVAWESLTQTRLFQGATPVETMLKVLHARAPALDSIRPELAPLTRAVAQALARNAVDRPASVQAFAQAIEAAARPSDGVASHAEVAELVERLAKDDLAARRRELSSFSDARDVESRLAGPTRPSRDEVVTQTLMRVPADAWQATAHQEARRSLRPYGVAAFLALPLALTGFLCLGQPRTTIESRTPAQTRLPDEPRALSAIHVPAPVAPKPSAALAASPIPRPRVKPELQKRPTPVLSAIPVLVRTPESASSTPLFPEQAPPNPYAVSTDH
jgi:serine/threonine-protein kinase